MRGRKGAIRIRTRNDVGSIDWAKLIIPDARRRDFHARVAAKFDAYVKEIAAANIKDGSDSNESGYKSTGALARSLRSLIKIDRDGFSYTIGSDLPYAAIRNMPIGQELLIRPHGKVMKFEGRSGTVFTKYIRLRGNAFLSRAVVSARDAVEEIAISELDSMFSDTPTMYRTTATGRRVWTGGARSRQSYVNAGLMDDTGKLTPRGRIYKRMRTR